MKNLLVVSALVLGFSSVSFADNHGHAKSTKKVTTTTETTAEAPAVTVAMTKKDATTACAKEGKKGAELTACVTEKTTPAAH